MVGVKEVETAMTGFFKRVFCVVGASDKRGAALSFSLGALAVAFFVTSFVAPAPALDSSESRNTPASAALPMFKDPRAALRAGLESYHSGNPQNSVEALRYAAEGGESLAQWKLGRMYAEGDGVARDDAKAYDYFSKIVEHFVDDDPDPSERSMAANAFVAVGLYTRDGVASAKVAPDAERAFDLFRYAATYFRNADAQYNLGRMYLEGAAVKRDVRQGVNWLDLAARKGHVQAQAMLGELMFNGGAGVAPQRSRGLMYLTLAHDRIGSGDSWIADRYSRALNAASDEDRKGAVAMLESYLRRHE